MGLEVLLLSTLLLPSRPLQDAPDSEEGRLLRAWDLIEAGDLDAAASLFRAVDEADTNEWVGFFGLPRRHWIAAEYLDVIERRRSGIDTDLLFRSPRFRFHARAVSLSPAEQERIRRTFEGTLDRVAAWAGDERWTVERSRKIFVEIADAFDSPSPARTLIFFWDRQERSPRTEVTTRVLDERFLEVVLAHELTHVVLPHTCRPLAEGMANLAMREIFPGRELPLKRPRGGEGDPWPLREVLLFNWRAQGEKVRQVYAAMREGASASGLLEVYDNGDRFVALVDERWGREKLLDFYRKTNRDPATFDMLETVASELAPLDELEEMWRER